MRRVRNLPLSHYSLWHCSLGSAAALFTSFMLCVQLGTSLGGLIPEVLPVLGTDGFSFMLCSWAPAWGA